MLSGAPRGSLVPKQYLSHVGGKETRDVAVGLACVCDTK